MRWWKILGVERGADQRTIKRAYAAKLKTIRQDEDPVGFMELRDAYEAALLYADGQAQPPTITDAMQWADEGSRHGETIVQKMADKPEYQNAISVLTEVKTLMRQKGMLTDQTAWENIFDDPRLESIDDFTSFESHFIDYLLEETKYEQNRYIQEYHTKLRRYEIPVLRPPISKFIFQRLGWDNNNYARRYSQGIEWLAYQFGVYTNDTPEDYWYYDKLNIDRTVRWVEVEETDIHPGLLVLGTFAFLIVFGVFFSTIMRKLI